MIIEAINRNQMEAYIPDIQNIVAICIYSSGTGELDTPPRLKDGWKDRLFLRFDDIDPSTPKDVIETYDLKLFDKEQATKILSFILETDPNKVIINCDAGISRSVAVKLALEQIFNCVNLFLNKRYSSYNRYVAATIINCWEGK